MVNVTILAEAATVKAKARGAAKALANLLADKTLPEGLREQLEGVVGALRKTWGELEAEAGQNPDDAEATEGKRRLEEAASVGQYFEGMIHQAFTLEADEYFKAGLLSREERIGLSNAIGSALDAFVARLGEVAAGLYGRWWGEEPEATQTTSGASETGAEEEIAATGESEHAESAVTATTGLEGDFVELVERAVRGDGTMQVKLIQPGWGSSGYYAPEVLERDGPKVFRRGTKMFWNHPTEQEERARPEGDLNNLAAELVGDARWDPAGTAGAGLYAEAKVFGGYKEAVEELAPHIGVSIRASGRGARGLADGREGMVLSAITGARSVDFVTAPGAGGQVVSLFEGKRLGAAERQDAITTRSVVTRIRDVGEELSMEERQELESLRETARVQADQLQAQQENLRKIEREAGLRRVGELAVVALSEVDLPEAARARVTRDTVNLAEARGILVDGQVDEEKLKEVIQELAGREREYVEALTAATVGKGGIKGMGASAKSTDIARGADIAVAKGEEALVEMFKGLGMGDGLAKEAAKGRG